MNVVIFAILTYALSLPLRRWPSVYAKPIAVCVAVFFILMMGRFSKIVQSVADDRYDMPEAVAVLFWNYSTLSIVAAAALILAIWILLNVAPDEDRES